MHIGFANICFRVWYIPDRRPNQTMNPAVSDPVKNLRCALTTPGSTSGTGHLITHPISPSPPAYVASPMVNPAPYFDLL